MKSQRGDGDTLGQTTIITAKGLIDVERQTVAENAYVRIENDRIFGWGPVEELPALKPTWRVWDHSHHFLLPGLINSHVHLCLKSDGYPIDFRQSKRSALETALRNLQAERKSGVTALRDCGDAAGVLFSLRDSIKQGRFDGPRLFLCGPPLTTSAGHAHFWGGVADTKSALCRRVEERCRQGADFIKLMATGGGTEGSDPSRAQYAPKLIAAVVKTAHTLGLRVAAHCRGTPGIVHAIEAGVDHIEHACFELPDGRLHFEPQLAHKMAQEGILVTPTIQLYRDIKRHLSQKALQQRLAPAEADYLALLPAVIEGKFRALQGFLDAGVTCVAGNDAGLPHTGFGSLGKELEAMVRGGMTPMRAILSATLEAAKALGIDRKTGSIRAGKQADLLVVAGNPAADIRQITSVRKVLQAGKVVWSST